MRLRNFTGIPMAALAAFALAAAGTVSAQEHESSLSPNSPMVKEGTHASSQDREIAKRVSKALKNDPNNFYRHVTVRVKDGIVKLSGRVDSNNAIENAQRIAQNVEGVTKVESNIRIASEPVTGGSH